MPELRQRLLGDDARDAGLLVGLARGALGQRLVALQRPAGERPALAVARADEPKQQLIVAPAKADRATTGRGPPTGSDRRSRARRDRETG